MQILKGGSPRSWPVNWRNSIPYHNSQWRHGMCKVLSVCSLSLFIWSVSRKSPIYKWNQITAILSKACYSRGFVDKERDFIMFESKVNESIFFMDSVATEWFAKEYVPWWLPLSIHVNFDQSGNLNLNKSGY